MVNTVAFRNTTGRPERKELLFTAAFWLMLFTSLSSGCRTRSRPHDIRWIPIASYLLPRPGSCVVIPTIERQEEEMKCDRITDICPLNTYNIIGEAVSRISLRFDRLLLKLTRE